MSTAPLEIKVIYSARGRSKPRPSGRTGKPAAPVVSRPRAKSWAVLGLMNFLASTGFYYATWWRVDPFLYMTAAWKAPIPGVDVNQAAALLNLSGPATGKPAPLGTAGSPGTNTAGGDLLVGSGAPARSAGVSRNALLFGSAMYGWLTLSTAAYAFLAVAAGAAIARAGGGALRRKWVILLCGALLGIAYVVFDIATRFGWKFPPNHLRWMMGALVTVGLLLGLAISRWPRGFTRLAALGIILAAAGSVAGLIALKECDALDKPEYASFSTLALVFALHSVYGWLLLPVSSRIGRS